MYKYQGCDTQEPMYKYQGGNTQESMYKYQGCDTQEPMYKFSRNKKQKTSQMNVFRSICKKVLKKINIST